MRIGDRLLRRAASPRRGRVLGLRRVVALATLSVLVALAVFSQAGHALAATNCPAPIDVSRYLTPQTETSPTWDFTYQISPNDGVVLKDVQLSSQLGGRFFAKQLSLPFYTLKTSVFGEHSLELKPASSDTVGRSRVVAFNLSTSNPNDMLLSVTYAVDHIPAGSASCLEITQRYEFWGVSSGCEPSGQLSCLEFRPMVSYRFLGANGETLTSIHTFQRLWFSDDKQANTAGVFQDCNTVKCGAQHPPNGCFAAAVNPVNTEMMASAIADGQPGSYDNYHQTYRSKVSEPNCVLNKAGCPECVHIHWRWSKLAGTAWGDGQPIIPPGSTQSAAFAIVRYHPGEEKQNPVKLVNGEDVTGTNIVFYWIAWNHQQHDSFFYHRIFFAPGPTLNLGPNDGCVGQTVDVTGTGFAPSETVHLTFGGKSVGTASTDSSGNLSGSFPVPATTGGTAPAGKPYEVVASGSGGALDTASATFALWSCLTLNGDVAPAGAGGEASGTGFGSAEALAITDSNGNSLTTASADSLGSFSGASFTVPPPPGGCPGHATVKIYAKGSSSRDPSAFRFLYIYC